MNGLTSRSRDARADAPEALAGSKTVADVLLEIRTKYGLAHVTYHLAHTVRALVDAPFVRTTYPAGWVAQYFLKGYVRVDPVVREGFQRTQPFDWSEISLSESDEPFLRDANAFRLGTSGYSIPLRDSARRRALLSLTSSHNHQSWVEEIARLKDEWADLAARVHRLAMTEMYGNEDPIPELTRREAECLTWIALGKDHKDIAAILGLSEYTVRDYTKTARLKLGCATLPAAVMRAGYLGIITPWEFSPPQMRGLF